MKNSYLPKRKKIGEILVSQNLITPEQLKEVLRIQKESSKPLGRILVEKEFLTEEELNQILGEQLGIPHVWLRKGLVDPQVVHVLLKAIRDGASDIHLESQPKKFRVRVRIDGVLYELMSPRIEMHPAIVSRLKVMANLDIAERRLPQDGRIQVNVDGRLVDLRFSSMPGRSQYPELLEWYNSRHMFGDKGAKLMYLLQNSGAVTGNPTLASVCVQCEKCLEN